jgi:hypothetical protein
MSQRVHRTFIESVALTVAAFAFGALPVGAPAR